MLVQSTSGAQTLLGLHKQKFFTSLLKRTKGPIRRGTLFLGGNLQTKLTRRSAGAVYIWMGYPGRHR